MTHGNRDRYKHTLKDLPFVKPCYIEELDATSDYLYYKEDPGQCSKVWGKGVHYWDVVDTMIGWQVFHTNFQVKILWTGSCRKAIYQNKDWTCGPFLIVTFMQTLLQLYVEKYWFWRAPRLEAEISWQKVVCTGRLCCSRSSQLRHIMWREERMFGWTLTRTRKIRRSMSLHVMTLLWSIALAHNLGRAWTAPQWENWTRQNNTLKNHSNTREMVLFGT